MNVWVRLEATREDDPFQTVERAGLRYYPRDNAFRSHTWTRTELHSAVVEARETGATAVSFGKAGGAGRTVKRKEWLLARAYIEAHGLSYWRGTHPQVREKDLHRLEKLREEVRRLHRLPYVPVPDPYLPDITVEEDRRYRMGRWFKANGLWLGLSVLFLIAFGLEPFKLVGFVAHVFWLHPDRLWAVIRLVAGAAFFMALIAFWATRYADTTPAPRAKPDRRYTIENFQERSAHGDGHLAKREEIAMALTGRTDGLSPKFEE